MLLNKQLNRQPGQRPVRQLSKLPGRQQGFVLILALVMLTVLTLIGVSSMNTANMELRSTANAQQHQIAFNAVQSLIEFTVSADTTIDYQPVDLSATQTVAYAFPDAKDLTAVVDYVGCNVGIGSSLTGKGFSYNFFNIAASGSNASGSANSTQTQGMRFPTASCGP